MRAKRLKLAAALAAIILTFIVFQNFTNGGPSSSGVTLPGHVIGSRVQKSTRLGRVSSQQVIEFAVAMKLPRSNDLDALIARQHTPGDELYGHYLTQAEFVQQFSPSQADVTTVASSLTQAGLTVTGVSNNRALIWVKGTVGAVENALGTEMQSFQTSDGRQVRGLTTEPQVSAEVADKIHGFIGLDTFAKANSAFQAGKPGVGFGSAPGGGMSPGDFKNAYGFSRVLIGGGQTMAVVEFDGYNASDINTYAQQFGFAAPKLTNVVVDGATGVPSTYAGAGEVVLDVDMMMAMAPGAKSILVYMAPNGSDAVYGQHMADVLHRIANDNLASVISCSWSLAEGDLELATLQSENAALQQMAAQGQSFFADTGDTGSTAATAHVVQDPSSQPYAVAVGGTKLTLSSTGAYVSENSETNAGGPNSGSTGSGGGISAVWALPSWQTGLATAANYAGTANGNRMIPDVSLSADVSEGYSFYYSGSWIVAGGTSFATPIWAGFMTLVNQYRQNSGLSHIGFPNIALYQIARSSLYSSTFHDVADGSTNGYFPAVAGYDLSTGWGSFQGNHLFVALTNPVLPPSAPSGLVFTRPPQLTWTESSSPAATGYVVQQSSDGVNYTTIATPTTNSVSLSTVTKGDTYYFRVAATNASGTSAYSPVLEQYILYPMGGFPAGSQFVYNAEVSQASLIVSQQIASQGYNVSTKARAVAVNAAGLGSARIVTDGNQAEANQLALESCYALGGSNPCVVLAQGETFAVSGASLTSPSTYTYTMPTQTTVNSTGIPFLNFATRATAAAEYNASTSPKAMAISMDGTYMVAAASGIFGTGTDSRSLPAAAKNVPASDAEAQRMAMEMCEMMSAFSPCTLYALDAQVVLNASAFNYTPVINYAPTRITEVPGVSAAIFNSHILPWINTDYIYISADGDGGDSSAAGTAQSECQTYQSTTNGGLYPCFEYAIGESVAMNAQDLTAVRAHSLASHCSIMPRSSCAAHAAVGCKSGSFYVISGHTVSLTSCP